MPEAFISSTTSPGPGVGSGKSTSSSSQSPRNTTPFIFSTRFQKSEVRNQNQKSEVEIETRECCSDFRLSDFRLLIPEYEPGTDGNLRGNWRKIREQLGMLLHNLDDVFRLDVPVDVEGGFEKSEPVEPIFRAPQSPIIVGREAPVVLLDIELHGGFGHFRLEPGNPARRHLRGLLGIGAHPFVGLGDRGEE